MRIAVGGFMHETNTFVEPPTTWADFVRGGALPTATEGSDILKVFRGINLAIAHFMDAAETAGPRDGAARSGAARMPGGYVTDDAFERTAMRLEEGLRREKGRRGVPRTARRHGDGEPRRRRSARCCAACARSSGPRCRSLSRSTCTPTSIPRSWNSADFISSYQTYPHVDWGASGGRCAEWLDRVLAGKVTARAFRQLPFLDPGDDRLHLCRALEGPLRSGQADRPRRSGVHLSLNMGFPPADIPHVGPSVTAYGTDQAAVDAAADKLLAAVIAAEAGFAGHRPLPVAEAVAEAMRLAQRRSKPDRPRRHAGQFRRRRAVQHHRPDRRTAAPEAPSARSSASCTTRAPAAAAHAAGVGGTLDTLGGGLKGPGQEPTAGPVEGRSRQRRHVSRAPRRCCASVDHRHGADRAAVAGRRARCWSPRSASSRCTARSSPISASTSCSARSSA